MVLWAVCWRECLGSGENAVGQEAGVVGLRLCVSDSSHWERDASQLFVDSSPGCEAMPWSSLWNAHVCKSIRAKQPTERLFKKYVYSLSYLFFLYVVYSPSAFTRLSSWGQALFTTVFLVLSIAQHFSGAQWMLVISLYVWMKWRYCLRWLG